MSAKFTFDEAFNEAYDQYIAIGEQENLNADIASLNEEAAHCSDEFVSTIGLLQEFMPTPYAMGNTTTLGRRGDDRDNGNAATARSDAGSQAPSDDDRGAGDGRISATDSIRNKSVADLISALSSSTDSRTSLDRPDKATQTAGRSSIYYSPEPVFTVDQSIKDVGFPQNVFLFIKALVTWIKNHILDIIDKLTNVIRNMLGMSIGPARIKPEDLKFNLVRAQKVQTYIAAGNVSNLKQATDFTDVLKNKPNGHFSEVNQPVQAITVSSDQIKPLFAGYMPEEIGTALLEMNTSADVDHQVVIISVDTTKDLMDLKEYLNHFFSLFDDAFGSNGEQLFTPQDLQILLVAFKKATDELIHPENQVPIVINGQISLDYNQIDADKVRDNMIRTLSNTNMLKDAYTHTSDQIALIAKVIGDKNIQGVTSMGAQYALLNVSSMNMLIDLVDITDRRLKNAVGLEKQLEKMKAQYLDVVENLNKFHTVNTSLTKVTTQTGLQRKVDNLYNAARYASQTVEYRLSALSLYISELNDVRATLINLNAINKVNAKTSKFKEWIRKILHRD